MAKQTFKTFISGERKRLTKLRQDAVKRKGAIDKELAEIDSELKAIAAYETAKGGKGTSARTGTTKRRSGRRAEVLNTIKQHPEGINRADLLQTMGAKGDKSNEQSVSNALSALKKAGQIDAREGKYTAVVSHSTASQQESV